MRYDFWRKICANWSTTSKTSDYSTEYELVKYTDYVDRFKDFVKKYPTVTIEATCKADSDLWDDPDCSKYSREFETHNFDNANNQYYNRELLTQRKNGFGWDVGAEIGFGFKIKDGSLYLRPFVNGWVYKAGAWWSCLDIGLGAYKIIFNPDSSNMKNSIHALILLAEEKKNEGQMELSLASNKEDLERILYVTNQ